MKHRAPTTPGYLTKPTCETMVRLPRTCLSCRRVFDSAWAGERICLRCKGTNAWRSGSAVAASRFG